MKDFQRWLQGSHLKNVKQQINIYERKDNMLKSKQKKQTAIPTKRLNIMKHKVVVESHSNSLDRTFIPTKDLDNYLKAENHWQSAEPKKPKEIIVDLSLNSNSIADDQKPSMPNITDKSDSVMLQRYNNPSGNLEHKS